jgi:hypothetical protein
VPRPPGPLLLALLVGLVVALAGCGGDQEGAAGEPQPPVVTTPEPTPTVEPTGTPTAEPPAEPEPEPTATLGPEDQEGGAGDEEAPRVPVRFTIDGEGLTPPQVSVPAFFPVVLTIDNALPRAVTVTLGNVEITVDAGSRGQGRHPGLRPGEHAVDAGAAGRATVLAGAEPGP